MAVNETERTPIPALSALLGDVVCWNWVRCLRHATHDGWDVVLLPEGAVLFHGTDAWEGVPDGAVPRTPTYLATLESASIYAFARNDTVRGERGKVIAVETTAPIAVLDMNARTLDRLDSLAREHYGEYADAISNALEYAFARGERRRSNDVQDNLVTQFICSASGAGLMPAGVVGWASPSPSGFHDEFVLCDASALERLPLEVRYSNDFPDHVFFTWRGRVVDLLDIEGRFAVKPERGAEFAPKPWDEVRQSDAYLRKSGWRDRLQRYRSARPRRFADVGSRIYGGG
jgi:hypothetical protein